MLVINLHYENRVRPLDVALLACLRLTSMPCGELWHLNALPLYSLGENVTR